MTARPPGHAQPPAATPSHTARRRRGAWGDPLPTRELGRRGSWTFRRLKSERLAGNACDTGDRLPRGVRRPSEPVPGARHGPGDRRRQPRLLRGDRTNPGRAGRAVPLRHLPRQPRRPGGRRGGDPESLTAPCPVHRPDRSHGVAEVRHPGPRQPRGVQGAVVDRDQRARPRPGRKGGLDHPPVRGHDRRRPLPLHGAPAVGQPWPGSGHGSRAVRPGAAAAAVERGTATGPRP